MPSQIYSLLTVLNAASISAATKTTEQFGNESFNAHALAFVFDVTALVGTSPTLQLILELIDPISGKFVSFGTFTAVTAAGVYTYLVGLGVGAAADGITATKSYPVPLKWRARVVGGGTAITDADYTLSCQQIAAD